MRKNLICEMLLAVAVVIAIAAATPVFVKAKGLVSEYGIEWLDDDGCYQLFATVDGQKAPVGTCEDLFGPENWIYMNIKDQDDFDGDGVLDALVYDANIGTAPGSDWLFVTYDKKTKQFKKTKAVSEQVFYTAEISVVDGHKVLDFVHPDMGQKMVKERYGFEGGKMVPLPTPKYDVKPYKVLKSIDMAKLYDLGDSFSFDLNDDGVEENVTLSKPSCRVSRFLSFEMDGKKYDFEINSDEYAGKLYILDTKTNGMRDIIVDIYYRTIYNWNGTTYATPDIDI